jgi:hypothetical protein
LTKHRKWLIIQLGDAAHAILGSGARPMPQAPVGYGDLGHASPADPSFSEHRGLLNAARDAILSFPDSHPKQRGRSFLADLQRALDLFELEQIDLGGLPQLEASALHDGSILFEWVLTDCRLGFNIEPNPDESSWCLVTPRARGAVNASGLLSGTDLDLLLRWLLLFVARWS